MKKFTSILFALAIMLSVNAAPVNKRAQALKAQRAQVEVLRAEKKAAPVKKALKSVNQKKANKVAFGVKNVKFTENAKKFQGATVARAPKAQQAAIELEANSIYSEYYPDTKDDFYNLQCGEDFEFRFDILLPNGEPSIELGKTYTYADMDPDYSFMRDYTAGGANLAYSEASLVKTEDEAGLVRVEASVVLAESGLEYHIVYQEEAIEPGTFDITIGQVNWQFFAEDNDAYYNLISKDNLCSLTFDIIVAEGLRDVELDKAYTLEDMIFDYTNVKYNGVSADFKSVEFKKSVDEEGLTHIEGTATDTYDRVFNFSYAEEPFIPTGDTIRHDIAATATLSYFASYEQWSVRADDGVYGLAIDYFSDNAESPAGSFTEADFDIAYCHVEKYTSDSTSNQYSIVKGSLDVTVEGDTTLFAASLLAEDGNVYEINAFFAVPKKLGEATIEATNLVLDDSFIGWGIAFAQASNDEYAVSLTLYPSEGSVLGSYVATDEFGGSISKAGGKSANIYSGEITIANSEEGKVLSGKVLCFDNIEYTLNLVYVRPEKTREESITITDAKLVIYPEIGDWQVTGINADQSRYVSIDILGELASGDFTEADIDAYYTFIGNVFTRNDSLLLSEQFDPLALNIKVDFNAADSTAKITGTYLGIGYLDNSDVPEFTLDITAKVSTYAEQQGGNEYDEDEDYYGTHFPTYTVDSTYAQSDGAVFVEAINANNEYVVLELWLPEGATKLAAGDYAVSAEEYVPGTLTATNLDLSSGKIYGSFVGIISGNSISQLWFIADGKATVTESGVIELKAVSTKGKRVEARLGEYPEGIENTDASVIATKRIVNGQLLIEKNGVKYNAQGTIVK